MRGYLSPAVKTTGIFCRPTCTARKPRRENVEFFASARDALLHGYRPCRVCNAHGEERGRPGLAETLAGRDRLPTR